MKAEKQEQLWREFQGMIGHSWRRDRHRYELKHVVSFMMLSESARVREQAKSLFDSKCDIEDICEVFRYDIDRDLNEEYWQRMMNLGPSSGDFLWLLEHSLSEEFSLRAGQEIMKNPEFVRHPKIAIRIFCVLKSRGTEIDHFAAEFLVEKYPDWLVEEELERIIETFPDLAQRAKEAQQALDQRLKEQRANSLPPERTIGDVMSDCKF